MSSQKKEPTRNRILEVSFRLFLKHGYSATGLNQIVEEAETVKASLYQHFSSKEELGKEVLKEYSSKRIQLIKGLMQKFPYPLDFTRAWTRILKHEASQSKLHGCGMANFRAQIQEKETLILAEIQTIANETIQTIEEFLITAKEKSFLSSNAPTKELALQLFYSYEGVLQSYRILGDAKTLNGLTKLSELVLNQYLKRKR
ncbi:MAG: TetR/AcrR family transcriptional regulator [Leptospiraceae bacterium]|nr:TetR/AcrR family transcriptional regulator [Leptospiraceae bacterium]